MKKVAIITVLSFLIALTINAQNDTMYVMKNGKVINKQSVKTSDVDSVIFYKPSSITQPSGTVTDYEGNVYNTVTIGTQVWMKENLNTTRYNDGTAIPNVTDNTAWAGLSTGAYCNYNNDVSNTTTYGRLYNWYAVKTGKLCPTGWHVPSDAEWTTLETYLIANGYNYDGTTSDNKIAKSMASTTGWSSSPLEGEIGNTLSANNTSGFSAFPGGIRVNDGTFSFVGLFDSWWSSTEGSTSSAYSRYLSYDLSSLDGGTDGKVSGFSVRCLRN